MSTMQLKKKSLPRQKQSLPMPRWLMLSMKPTDIFKNCNVLRTVLYVTSLFWRKNMKASMNDLKSWIHNLKKSLYYRINWRRSQIKEIRNSANLTNLRKNYWNRIEKFLIEQFRMVKLKSISWNSTEGKSITKLKE